MGPSCFNLDIELSAVLCKYENFVYLSVSFPELLSVVYSAESHSVQSLLPKQLEVVKGAVEFPVERHRWNTNEVFVLNFINLLL